MFSVWVVSVGIKTVCVWLTCLCHGCQSTTHVCHLSLTSYRTRILVWTLKNSSFTLSSPSRPEVFQKRQDIRAWMQARRIRGWPPCSWGEERSKGLGWCEDKGYNGEQGEDMLSGSTRTQKIEARARTSSQSIEPSEHSLHGGGGSILIFYCGKTTNTRQLIHPSLDIWPLRHFNPNLNRKYD